MDFFFSKSFFTFLNFSISSETKEETSYFVTVF